MTIARHLGAIALAALIAVVALPAAAADAPRDGQHDFDFNIGTWRTHIRRITDALYGGAHSIELNGTVTVHKVWDGRGQIEEIEADGPKGHWEGLTLFLYNPQGRQWTQTFGDNADGLLTTPLIGAFKDGRGELYAQEVVDNRAVLIRGIWSDITPDAHHFQEDYSQDGGRTWTPVFIAELTRERP